VAVTDNICLYDLDPASLAPDLHSLERQLSAGARVVVASPLYGIPIAWDAVRSLCDQHGALLIEDAAQGHGAEWKGMRLGSLGEIGVLSFGRGKGWTGGAGGAVLLRTSAGLRLDVPEIIEGSARGLLHGLLQVSAQWALGRPSTYSLPAALPWLALGETVYHAAAPPRRFSGLSAGILLATRTAAEREAAQRRARADAWHQSLRSGRVLPIRWPAEGVPGFLRYPVRANGGLSGFTSPAMARSLGIMPSYPATLGSLPPVQARLKASQPASPGAEELVRTLVTIPTHSRLSSQDRTRIGRLLVTYGGGVTGSPAAAMCAPGG
jgi:dTDP-4-amino-4,6-dideoxygalactose transaminase